MISCSGQTKNTNPSVSDTPTKISKLVGGGCDGCELMYVGMPSDILSIDTSSGWYAVGQKLLVTGTVFKLDGKTKAPDVVIYYWQTDDKATIRQRMIWTN